MRAPIAYLAGAGTVIVAIGLGLGGGLTIAKVLSPHQEKVEQTRLEQRMAAKPIPQPAEADQVKMQAANTAADKPSADQPKEPAPYLAATQAASAPVVVTPPTQSQNQPQTQTAAPAPQAGSPAATTEQASTAPDQSAKPAEPQAMQQASSPEDANAKARDSDLKRLAAEKRKSERRQKWADRKKAQQQRDAELRDVEASVRRDTDRPLIREADGPRIVVRQDDDDFGRRRDSDRRRGSDRPFGFSGFNLFGPDHDD